jgi:hypothetical protein
MNRLISKLISSDTPVVFPGGLVFAAPKIFLFLRTGVLSCFLLFTFFHISAQNNITAKAGTDKTKILLGERIKLTLEASFPANEVFNFFTVDTFPNFEIIESKKIDTVSNGSEIFLKQEILITSFDSGHWVIPSFVLNEKLQTDTIPVDVGYTVNFDPKQKYNDIKDIIEPAPEEKKKPWWFWYAVAAGGALIALVIYLLTRKKKRPAVTQAPVIDLNAYSEAIKKLEALKKENPSAKILHIQLTDIFRMYVQKRKGLQSMQKTTDDLIVQLKSLNMDKDRYNELAQALRLTDFVKFAKYEPAAADNENVFTVIKNAITQIEKS